LPFWFKNENYSRTEMKDDKRGEKITAKLLMMNGGEK
jgi:hypothetical protein